MVTSGGVRRYASFLSVFLALTLAFGGTAFAAECHAVGSQSGSETMHIGASGSSQAQIAERWQQIVHDARDPG